MPPVIPPPVLRIISCLTNKAELLETVEHELVGKYGPIVLESEAFEFELSTYYEDEMGDQLERYWFCFEELFGAETLSEYRLETEQIEQRHSSAKGRVVNLDPGYLDYHKLVLASLKEGADKIYMGKGVWAHTCLRFRHGCFTAPDHSFADFKDGRFNSFMKEAREEYRNLLRQHRKFRSADQ